MDYLKDMFGWNYTLYKLGENSVDSILDKEIVKLTKECNNFFYDNMNTILGILEEAENNE